MHTRATRIKKHEENDIVPGANKLKKQCRGNTSDESLNSEKQDCPAKVQNERSLRNFRTRKVQHKLKKSDYVAVDLEIAPEMLIATEKQHEEKKLTVKKKKSNIASPNIFSEFDNCCQLVNYHDIIINMEDYKGLDCEGLLSDSLLDFWLRYIQLELMSEKQRKKVHIYSSQFYNMYSMSSEFTGWSDQQLPATEKRYNRVKDFICHVESDLFNRDFVLFPCFDKQHWFLTVICFPKLNGTVAVGGNVPGEGEKKDPSKGDPIESPCILIFDSLTNPTRKTNAMIHIANYMYSFYMERHHMDFPFDKTSVVRKTVKVGEYSKIIFQSL